MYSVQPVYTVQCSQNCTKIINSFFAGILYVSDVTPSLYLNHRGDCCALCIILKIQVWAQMRIMTYLLCTVFEYYLNEEGQDHLS